MKSLIKCCWLLSAGLSSAVNAELIMDGNVSIEQRLFLDRPDPLTQPIDDSYPYPVYHQISLAASPHIYISPQHSKLEYTIHPFLRFDERDSERTHADFRELKASYVSKGWQFSLGFDQVHWGVMENHHLVDIVNQTDYNESPNGEDKLGQPMARFALLMDDATIETLILLGYREPSMPTQGARFSFRDDYGYEYEGWGSELHPDVAFRYEKRINKLALGIGYFGGHNRTPELRLGDPGSSPVWYVNLVNQASLDVKAKLNKLELKAEVLYRVIDEDSTRAAVLGGEYQFLRLSGIDFNLLSEYSWDQRGQRALDNNFQNDILAGLRVKFNKLKDSEILIGQNYDFDFDSQHGFVQANFNLTAAITVGIEAWWFDIQDDDFANKAFNDDNMIQLTGFYNF